MSKTMTKAAENLKAHLANLAKSASLEMADVSLVDPYPRQTRKLFAQEALEELAKSIRVVGQIDPIHVRRVGKRLELIAGERRVLATRLNGDVTIKAFIYDISDDVAEQIHRAENAQRENLSQSETANAVKGDLDKLKKARDVAALWGKSEAWVSKMLTYASLGDVAEIMVTENLSSDMESIAAVEKIARKDKGRAKALVETIRANPKGNVRQIVKKEKDAQAAKTSSQGGKAKKTLAVATNAAASKPIQRDITKSMTIGVEYHGKGGSKVEFNDNLGFGDATISPDVKHKNGSYAWVLFGDAHLAEYLISDLRIAYVD